MHQVACFFITLLNLTKLSNLTFSISACSLYKRNYKLIFVTATYCASVEVGTEF
jgi:hypothetical protein